MSVINKIKILDFDIQTKDYFVTISRQSKVVEDKRAFLDKLDQRIKAAKKRGSYAELAKRYRIE